MITLSFMLLSLLLGGSSREKPKIEPCVAGVNAPPAGTWRLSKDAIVSIYYLRGNFNEREQAVVADAIIEWNRVLDESGSHIHIQPVREVERAAGCANCITVMRGSTFEHGRHLAETHPQLIAGTSEFFSGEIVIDSFVTNPEALKSVMVHELGHALGIDDCPQCPRGTTIMALFRGRNQSNKLSRPSDCDKVMIAGEYRK